jgi:hypothetical protein
MSKKLYGLYIVENDGDLMRFVAGSNEIQKLKDVTLTKGWYICSKLDRDRKKMAHTERHEYPYYVILEVPYVV